jgi:oleate hydratase
LIELTQDPSAFEILRHLRADTTPAEKASQLFDHAVCIPCLMPFITRQFLPRERGDRPDVLPEGSANLAFIGQFCELPA